jgi:hypothetical protein
MQQRRFRPGDVLDDYCPRERRITDHAIVAMIEDRIQQTRCVVCDAEHEYKEAKLPAQRRRRPQSALFEQVLDNLQRPQRAVRVSHAPDADPDHVLSSDDFSPPAPAAFLNAVPSEVSGNGNGVGPEAPALVAPVIESAPPVEPPPPAPAQPDQPVIREEGSVRRSLIRATLPRPEGQSIPTRAMPEFTIRQPNNGRGGHRSGGRRRSGHHQQGANNQRSSRFGRGSGHGQGQGQGPREHGGRNQGPHGGRRRGRKKR